MRPDRRIATRADRVRTRRAKEMKQRVIMASDGLKKPVAAKPIQSRDGEGVLPIIQKPRKRNRRRLFLKIFPGLEIKLPAFPIINPGWRLVSAVIFIISAFCTYAFYTSPFFTVSQISLDGAERVTLADVEAVLPVKGQKILTVTPRPIEKLIKNAYPVVEDVDVTIGWPASIHIKVTERVPVLAWDKDGVTRWISADGVAFEPRGEAEGLVTVYAEGNPPSGGYNLSMAKQDTSKPLASLSLMFFKTNSDEVAEVPAEIFIAPEMIPVMQEMAKQVPEGVAMVYHPRYGIGWTDPKGWEVYFGMQPTEMPQKLAAYNEIVKKLSNKGVQPELISMENLYAPYYRTEQ